MNTLGNEETVEHSATELVTSAARLQALVDMLRGQPVVGLDTEAASFHRYRDRVYLLQVSTRDQTAVVDPLATDGLEPLRTWLADPETEFVFHDADYDLRLLRHEFGMGVARLFDTRVAAQFLNLPGIGLGALLEQRYGVTTDKRWQRADWSARPLSPEMVAYAATDTRYLPQLRDELRDQLLAVGRLAWVEEECERSVTVEWQPGEPPEISFLNLKGARDLDRRGLAVLRELVVWREQIATTLDRALFRVLGNETLLLLAAQRPTTAGHLETLRGIGRDTLARRGSELLAAVARGLAVPEEALPRFERRPRFRPDPAFQVRVERLKAWRTARAATIGLMPGILAPNATLEAIARALPKSLEELGQLAAVRRWQCATFGTEILAELAKS